MTENLKDALDLARGIIQRADDHLAQFLGGNSAKRDRGKVLRSAVVIAEALLSAQSLLETERAEKEAAHKAGADTVEWMRKESLRLIKAKNAEIEQLRAEKEALENDNEAYRRTHLFLADQDYRKRSTDAAAQYQEGFEDGRHVPLTVEDIRAGKHHDTWEERLDSAHKSLQTATEALKEIRARLEPQAHGLIDHEPEAHPGEDGRHIHGGVTEFRAVVEIADRALKQIESGTPLEIGEVE